MCTMIPTKYHSKYPRDKVFGTRGSAWTTYGRKLGAYQFNPEYTAADLKKALDHAIAATDTTAPIFGVGMYPTYAKTPYRRQYVNHKGHRIHGLLEIQQGQFTFLPPNHWMTETHQQGKQCNWNLRIVIVANKAGWQKHCEDPDAAAECLKEALTSCLQSKVTTVEVTRQMRRAANVHDQGEDKPAQQSSPDYTIDTRPWQRYELPEVALQDMVNSHTTQMCTKCTAPQPLQWE
eukprot:gene1526-biopygen1389